MNVVDSVAQEIEDSRNLALAASYRPSRERGFDTAFELALENEPGAQLDLLLGDELTVHVPPPKMRREKASTGTKQKKDIEDHLNVCMPEVREVFQQFRVRVKNISWQVAENVWTYGVAYKAGQNFVELYFRSNRLEVCMRNTRYADPENLLGKVPDSYKWTLSRRFLLEDQSQLDYVLGLVKQSYHDVA